jgi:hypothetical protein
MEVEGIVELEGIVENVQPRHCKDDTADTQISLPLWS